MKVFLWGSALFCIPVLLHLVIWKIRLPQNQLAVLLKIFLFVFSGWLAIALAHKSSYIKDYVIPLSFAEVVHISLFALSLSLSYLAAYSTVDADSPSLKMALTIYNAGPTGLDKHELTQLFNMDRFFKSRLDRLVEDRMVVKKESNYMVTPMGRLFMNMVVHYRIFLGAPRDLG